MYLSLIFILTLIVPFVVMPKYIREGIISPYRIVVISMLGTTIMSVVVFIFAEISGVGVYEQVYEAVELIAQQAATTPTIIEALNLAGSSEAERVEMFVKIYDHGLMRLPSTIIFMAVIVSYIAYIIMSKIIGRKYDVKRMPKFREFTFPHGAGMAIMLMYFISWARYGSRPATLCQYQRAFRLSIFSPRYSSCFHVFPLQKISAGY